GNLPPGLYGASLVLASPTSAFPIVSIPILLTVTTGPSGFVPLGCNALVTVPPPVRQTGMTELLGEILLQCSNGTPTAAGAPVPAYDVQLTLNTPITSRGYA